MQPADPNRVLDNSAINDVTLYRDSSSSMSSSSGGDGGESRSSRDRSSRGSGSGTDRNRGDFSSSSSSGRRVADSVAAPKPFLSKVEYDTDDVIWSVE